MNETTKRESRNLTEELGYRSELRQLVVALSSASTVCVVALRLQPLSHISVKHKVKPNIGLGEQAPRSLIRTKLDATLAEAVFIEIAIGKGQMK
jgi:hypothetical protein